jgi:hypothetical protein
MHGFSLILRNRTLCARQLVLWAIKARPFLAHQRSSLISLSSDIIVAGSSVWSIQVSCIIDRTGTRFGRSTFSRLACMRHLEFIDIVWAGTHAIDPLFPSIRSPIQQVPFVSQLTRALFSNKVYALSQNSSKVRSPPIKQPL